MASACIIVTAVKLGELKDYRIIMLSHRIILLIVLLFFFAFQEARDESAGYRFDLKGLAGVWEGIGEAVIPKTSIPLDIAGKACFTYDSVQGYLRTMIVAEKFFFTYVDSGHLYHNPTTDSILWDIWDGFGKFGQYRGRVNGPILTGVMEKEKWRYHIVVNLVNRDSLTFTLTARKDSGEWKPRASIDLWRVRP